MASRKKRKSRRSQKYEEEDFAARPELQEEEEDGASARQPMGELVEIMKDFFTGQQKRDEGLLEELRTLKAAMPGALPSPLQQRRPPPRPPPPRFPTATSSPNGTLSTESPRRGLPTPGGTRVVMRSGHQERDIPDIPSFSNVDNEGGPRPDWRHFSDPKIPPYQIGEDIENYLLRFERIAKTWRWPESEWACRLVPLLSGKALEAYSAMDEDEAQSYTCLKAALLTKFDISPETYRQRFRISSLPSGETPTETYHRLKGLYRRWIRPDQLSKDAIGELIVMEQLLCVLPPDVRTWVKEHEPEDGLTFIVFKDF